MAYDPIIQEEVDEVLAKDVNEPLIGVAGFMHMHLWLLSALMVYGPHSILCILIAYAHTFF